MDLTERVERLEQSNRRYQVVILGFQALIFSVVIIAFIFAGKKDETAPIVTRELHIVDRGGDTLASLRSNVSGGSLFLFDTNRIGRVRMEADAFGSGIATRYPDDSPGIRLWHNIMDLKPEITVNTPTGEWTTLYPPASRSGTR